MARRRTTRLVVAGSETLARGALAIGIVITLVAALAVAAAGKPAAAVVLTVTAAVGMINGIWLERALAGVLQPGRPRYSRGAVALLMARWGLWGLLFGALFVFRQYVEFWAVAAGMGCFVIALAIAGVGRAGDNPGEG